MYPKLNPDVYLARNHLGLLTPGPQKAESKCWVVLSLVLFETRHHHVVSWPSFVAMAGFNLLFLLPLPLEF